MEQATLLHLGLVNLLPFGDAWSLGAVGVAAARHAVLQDSGLMAKQALGFFALGADLKANLRLIEAGVHEQPANAYAVLPG